MKLIVISPSQYYHEEISILQKMFEAGLPVYHLRKMNFSTCQLKNFIAEISEKFHSRIVIHTHHELVTKFNLKGIYISPLHKKRKLRTWLRLQLLKLKRKNFSISTTFRNAEQLMENSFMYDYVFLSPVFDSMAGKFQAGFSEYNLKKILQQSQQKIIARGGVSPEKILKAMELGFAGIALHSFIWENEDPFEQFLKVKNQFTGLKIPME